ncbi:MAG: hypothetical protein OQL19_19125 [Gammaproteobacteria bacterium]|nr:hypothetical protein [Gammaproteobacteria bacterium]
MNSIKTILSTTAIISTFAFSTVQANGFFNADSDKSLQKHTTTFDASVHEGTTFWSYFNKGMSKQTPKIDQVASFDESKHAGTAFWGYHSH